LATQVIAVHGDIESAHRNLDTLHFVHHHREPLRQRDTTGGNPHQHEILCAAVRLEDLVSHSRAYSCNLNSVEDYTRIHGAGPDARRRIIRLGLWHAGT
jgi:hypothetical protein